MNVLLLKEDREVRHMLAFTLESQFQLVVREVVTIAETLEAFNKDPSRFDFVLLEDELRNKPFLDHLRAIGDHTPVLVLRKGANATQIPVITPVIGSVSVSALGAELKQFLPHLKQKPRTKIEDGVTQEPAEYKDGEYVRIQSALVFQVLPLLADLYLKLSEEKFVRVFKKGDVFKSEDIQAFLQKKQISFVFIKKEDSNVFIDRFKSKLQALYDDPKQSEKDSAQVAANVHEAVVELGGVVGFTPEVQELAKAGVKSALKSIGTSPRLAKFLRNLATERDKYITAHSVILAQVCCSIAALLKWPSGSTFQKLTYAAFFHDMMFRNQKLAQVKSLAELEGYHEQFTPEDVHFYKAHPALVAQLIMKMTEVPPDVDVILHQHHERADGSGFPRGLSGSNIAPLAAVFIVAHDLVSYMFEAAPEVDFAQFLEQYKAKNSVGHFRKILEVLTPENLKIGE